MYVKTKLAIDGRRSRWRMAVSEAMGSGDCEVREEDRRQLSVLASAVSLCVLFCSVHGRRQSYTLS